MESGTLGSRLYGGVREGKNCSNVDGLSRLHNVVLTGRTKTPGLDITLRQGVLGYLEEGILPTDQSKANEIKSKANPYTWEGQLFRRPVSSYGKRVVPKIGERAILTEDEGSSGLPHCAVHGV